MKYQVCICHKDQKEQVEKHPGQRRQSSSLTWFGTPMITENNTNQIREVETGEASQGQRSAVLCKFKTTVKSLFDTTFCSNRHARIPVSA